MKKVFLFATAAIAALAMFSCNKEIDVPAVSDETCPEGYYVEELTAVYPSDPETRTAFNEDTGKFAWTEGDELAFHLSNGEYTSAAIDPGTGKVKLYLPVGVTRDNYAVYPASAVVDNAAAVGNMKVTLPDSYDISADLTSDFVPTPLVATNDAENKHLKFEHVGGLLQVTLNVPAGVKTAKVSMGKQITGTFTLEDGTGNGIIAPGAASSDEGVTFVLSESGLTEETEVKLLTPLPSGSYDLFKVEFDDSYVFSKDISSSPWVFVRSGGKKVTISEENFEDVRDYFWIEALEAGTTVRTMRTKAVSCPIEYSFDKKNWEKCTWVSTTGMTIDLANQGDRVYFRNPNQAGGVLYFQGTGKYKAGGDIMTLSNYVSPTVNFSFANLFKQNSALIDASEIVIPDRVYNSCYNQMFWLCENLEHVFSCLPAKELKNRCYQSMFSGCTNLKECPEILAESVGIYACEYMFNKCTSIIYPPALNAMVLDQYAYHQMFWGCTSLIEAPELPAEIVPLGGYYEMFYGCTGLKTAGKIHATEVGANGCRSMFHGCTSLEQAPDYTSISVVKGSSLMFMFNECSSLSSAYDIVIDNFTSSSDLYHMFDSCTSLIEAPSVITNQLGKETCYGMFQDCTGLKTMGDLPCVNLGENCYGVMFDGCTSLVNVIDKLPATTATLSCYNSMFRGCTSLVEAPEIMLTEMKQSCLSSMFNGCTRLKKIAVHFTSWSYDGSNGFSQRWVYNVPSSGSFYKPEALPSANNAVGDSDHVPRGWTEFNIDEL